MIAFALFSLVAAVSLGAVVYFSIGWKRAERRADTAEKAYAELTAQSARRERELLHELKTAVVQRDDFHGRWQSVLAQWKREVALSESLIPLRLIVRQYAKDMRETMALLKDETPPKELVAAEEALRLHDEQVKLRTQT